MKISKKYAKFYEKCNQIENENINREKFSAFYTDSIIIDELYEILPEFSKDEINILEPAVGAGNFIPLLVEKYKYNKVNLTIIDIDIEVIKKTKLIIDDLLQETVTNFNIQYINTDFLLENLEIKYDLIIGNPPYLSDKLHVYNKIKKNKKSTDLFSFFIEKSFENAKNIIFIIPKNTLESNKYAETRDQLESRLNTIVDFGSKGFKGVRIETIAISMGESDVDEVMIKSCIGEKSGVYKKNYVFDKKFPSWLIYRNENFDEVASDLNFGTFKVFRDRQITNKILQSTVNEIRVLRSKNIGNNCILNIEGYDRWVQLGDVKNLGVIRFLNKKNVVVVPNMTYYPRATFLPQNTIVNGSVALLEADKTTVNDADLSFFSTVEFVEFYKVARNYSKRTLNIDATSVFYFGIKGGAYARKNKEL